MEMITENYDLNNEPDKEERVKQWALEAKAKLDLKRDPSGYSKK
jgi:ABC-type bacteriocin/lantibiotic exporter with double-glycine peptidase domain